MDAREQARLRLTGQVMRLMRVKDFRNAFGPIAQGVAPVFVGLPNDPVQLAFERILELGGSAHVVIPRSAEKLDGFALLRMDVTLKDRIPDEMSDDEFQVDESTELAMMLNALRIRRTGVFYICQRGTTVELIDDGSEPVLVC